MRSVFGGFLTLHFPLILHNTHDSGWLRVVM